MFLQAIDIAVQVAAKIRTRKQAAVQQRGVIEFVLQYAIAFLEQCRQHAEVGHVTGRKQ